MPPLYRMPLVYLLALVVAAVSVAAARIAAPARPSNVQATPHNDDPAATPVKILDPVPAPGDAPPRVSPDGILRTPEGLRRKVVVRALDLAARPEPSAGAPTGRPLDYFSTHYLYEERPGWLLIGPEGGPPLGWVTSGDVLEWGTRLMARPTPKQGRPDLVLYRDRACLLEALAGRTCPQHGGNCPVEGEEPSEASAVASAGFPILGSWEVPLPDGTTRSIFEVASLVQDRAAVRAPERLPVDFQEALREMDIALVIDTTASMQGSIDAARRLAERLVAEASRRYADVKLRLALVEYRDEAPLYGFRARVVTGFVEPPSFRRALDRIEAARGGDGSVDERVLDGVELALPAEGNRPGVVARNLDWPRGRAAELSTRLIVVVGDAPDHDRDAARARRLAERARAARITIAGVTIQRADRSRDEQRRYEDQWNALAEGSYRPADRATGYRRPIGAALLGLEGADDLVPRLEALFDDRARRARELADLAAAEAESRLEAYVTSQGLSLDQVYPVLVDLHRLEEQPQARPDPRSSGRKAPSVRRGWIAERRDGARLVTVEVLMSRDELDALIGELLTVQQAAGSTAGGLAELLQIGTAAASGESAFLAADRGGLTFAEHLRRRQGLPPPRSDSLLRTTQADLLQLDEPTRAALHERLGTAIDRLVRRRDEPDWGDPARTIDGKALVPFEWIDL
jgi:hypothetical protein